MSSQGREERRESPSAREGEGLLRAGALVSALTLLSRILGLVRDVLMAHFLGRGAAAGAFYLAWVLPNLFRRLFGEGALSAAFLPRFQKEWARRGPEAARTLLSQVSGTLLLFLSLLVLLGLALFWALPLETLAALFSRSAPDPWAFASLFRRLALLLFPYVAPVCLLGLLSGALQARGHFALPALAPVLLNLFWIGGLLLGGVVLGKAGGELGGFLAWTILAGGAAQVLLQVPALARLGLLAAPRPSWRSPGVREVARRTAPALVGLAVFQVNALLDQVMAATLVPEVGGNAVLFYANRLFQFPLALVGTALAVASLPAFAEKARQGRKEELLSLFGLSARTVLFLALPAAFGLALLARPLLSLLFVHPGGRFTAADAGETARVLLFLAGGLPFVCLAQLATRVHYAMDDYRSPVRVGLALVGGNLLLNLLLVGPLGVAGLALATTVSSVLLGLLLTGRFPRLGLPPAWGGILPSLARVLPLCLLLSAAVLGTEAAAGGLPPAAALAAALAAGAGAYLLPAALLGYPEWRAFREALGRKRRS